LTLILSDQSEIISAQTDKDKPLSKASDRVTPGGNILPKDTEYRFPHLLLVSASAGSGKTHALALRYVQFLLSPVIPQNDIRNILAITFTKNAAREMKERIVNWLKALALECDRETLEQTADILNLDKKQIAARAGQAVDRIFQGYSDFQVQTIDSFSNNIFMSSVQDFDLPPDPEIVLNYSNLLEYALADLLSGAGTGRDQGLEAALAEFISLMNRTEGGSYVWNPEDRMSQRFAEFLEIEAKNTGSIKCLNQAQNIDRCLDRIGAAYQSIVARAKEGGLELSQRGKFGDHLAQRDIQKIIAKKVTPGTSPVNKPKKEDPLYLRLVEEWTALRPDFEELAYAYSASYYSAYAGIFGLFRHRLSSSQRRLGIIHINDLGKKLGGYLTQDNIPEVYLRMGARLNHFLIDEFQDTSPMQWQSLKPLLLEALSRNGSQFVVGDLKQAIYQFRQADYRIMRRMMQEIQSGRGGEMVPASVADNSRIRTLDCNQRSGGVIVDYADQVFKHRLRSLLGTADFNSDLTGLTDYAQEAVETKEGQGYVLVQHLPRGQAEDGGPGEDLETEGQVQDQICPGDRESPEKDRLIAIIRDAAARGHAYRDIAVLAFANRQLEAAVDWLNQAGIPVTSSSSLDIRHRKVIAELAELLKFLDSPIDDLAFYGFISGNIMARAAREKGVSLDHGRLHLLTVRARDNGEYLYKAFQNDPDLGGMWQEYLEPLFQKSGYYPLYDLLSLALRNMGVFANFPEEADPLIKMLESVNGLEARGANSIRDFIEQIDRENEELFSQELPEYTNAVRLMTFHKSKGLGFPVTINLLYDRRSDGDRSYYRKDGEDILVYNITKQAAEADPRLAQIYQGQKDDEQISDLNVLYVINTRARQELYNLIIYTPRKTGECFYQKLFPEVELGAKQNQPPRMKGTYLPTGITIAGPGSAETNEAAGQGWTQRRLHESRKGEAYHLIMESIADGEPGEEVDRVLGKLMKQGALAFFSDDEIDDMRQRTGRFLQQESVREWFREYPGKIIHREKEFVDRSGNLHRMDRVIIGREGITLIDFKTGAEGGHRRQIGGYVRILQEVYPGQDVKAYIAHVDTAGVEEVP
jgi:ATP-dependent helicase/nuclease subunit A